jgi:hypothetical protein
LVGVDLFKSDDGAPPLHASALLDLPQLVDDMRQKGRDPAASSSSPREGCIPAVLAVTLRVPLDPKKTKGKGGPCLTIMLSFGLTSYAADEAARLGPDSDPALKLLLAFTLRAGEDPDLFGRFKLLGRVDNPGECGLPKHLNRFMGKPSLVKEAATPAKKRPRGGAGSLRRGDGWLEIGVDGFAFSAFARKGMGAVVGLLGEADVEVGFGLEGRLDEELPEVLLGCANLRHLDVSQVGQWAG